VEKNFTNYGDLECVRAALDLEIHHDGQLVAFASSPQKVKMACSQSGIAEGLH